MKVVALTLAMVAIAGQTNRSAQNAESIVGTWRLLSASALTAHGRVVAAPFGSNPGGLITYTAEGRMHAIISHGGRKPLSGDRISSPVAERAEAFATSFAYAGRYSLRGDTVVHHVEVSSVQNWVATDMVRLVTFGGKRLTLRTPPLSVGGTTQVTELVWERIN